MHVSDHTLSQLPRVSPTELSGEQAIDVVSQLGAFGLYALQPLVIDRAVAKAESVGLRAQAAYWRRLSKTPMPTAHGSLLDSDCTRRIGATIAAQFGLRTPAPVDQRNRAQPGTSAGVTRLGGHHS